MISGVGCYLRCLFNRLHSQTGYLIVILEDQIEILRRNLPEIKRQKFCLPLMGGIIHTEKVYEFISLIHPARDISTMIHRADPSGKKLTPDLSNWSLRSKDTFGDIKTIQLKSFLNMIVHSFYIYRENDVIDVSDDSGKRRIVLYDLFTSNIERLILNPDQMLLVTCGFSENEIINRQKEIISGKTNSSGFITAIPDVVQYNFLNLFRDNKFPQLKNHIWDKFFSPQSKPLSDRRTVEDQPFSMSIKNLIIWKIGWRKGDVFSESWVNILDLIQDIYNYYSGSQKTSQT